MGYDPLKLENANGCTKNSLVVNLSRGSESAVSEDLSAHSFSSASEKYITKTAATFLEQKYGQRQQFK